MKVESINSLVLAYIGDAVYETIIRKYLIEEKFLSVQSLQQQATNYVSARNQSKFIKRILEEDLLTQEEKEIVYRARNHKVNHKPKNADIVTYKYATGLEALIGWLYLKKNGSRINEIMNYIKGMSE